MYKSIREEKTNNSCANLNKCVPKEVLKLKVWKTYEQRLKQK
jgi:hypothetical protein